MSESSPIRVMIDGYNLAMPKGTGVATYGYNLALASRNAGMRVDGLYGLRVPFNRRLREIMFYEAMGQGHASKRPQLLTPKWLGEVSHVIRSKKAREIPVGGGAVIARHFDHRLPEFDRIFSVPDLFEQAARQFRRFGTFLTVRVPNPPDIMHWTYPLPIRLTGAKNVYTLHDLVPLKLPFASLDNKRYYYKLMRRIARSADHVCTVSQSSAGDLHHFFPELEGRVTNSLQALRLPVSVTSQSDDDIDDGVSNLFNLPPRGYFLFFGAIEPKKNVGRLIEAYLSIATKTPLVIAGPRAWGAEAELRLLQKDKMQPLKATFRNVRRIEYLPRNLLMRLVRGAKAVLFPSLYEGFGLPVLEAMMLGTPVLTSDTSSLVEVAGDAAIKVNPYKTQDIAQALRALDNDADLRANLSALGKVQATKFSMEVYQDNIVDMYRKVLA